MPEQFKRETAYKLRIEDLLKSKQILDESGEGSNPKLQFVELGDKKILRVNIIANVIDKFESESERRFASITLDDGSGQVRARLFGEDIQKFQDLVQGDTIVVIGLLRTFNEELYILPDLIRKIDPKYLLIRKLEIEKSFPRPLTQEQKQEVRALRDEIIEMIKNSESNEGIDKEEIIMKLKDSRPDLINQEIQKLLEEGIIYEPKPGRVRYLG